MKGYVKILKKGTPLLSRQQAFEKLETVIIPNSITDDFKEIENWANSFYKR